MLPQRSGRLHRHRRAGRSGQDANGLGPHGGVYGSLHILEATRCLLAEYGEWRIPAMNRDLVERRWGSCKRSDKLL